MAFMKNEAAFQCKGILDRILLLMKLYQSVLHLEQFHVEERGYYPHFRDEKSKVIEHLSNWGCITLLAHIGVRIQTQASALWSMSSYCIYHIR